MRYPASRGHQSVWSGLGRCLKFCVVVLALTLVPARAAQITWSNPAGGAWNSPLNWSPNQVPGAADTAIINNAVTVRLDVSPTVGGITLGATAGCSAGGSILLLNGQTLTLNGPLVVNTCGQFTVDTGVLAGTTNATLNGTIGWSGGSLAGTLTLSSQSVLNISGSNDHNMPGCTFTNLGTVVWSGGRIRGGNTSIHNLGLWEAQSDQVMNNDFANGTVFNNLGTFRKSGGVSQSTFTVFASGVVFNQRSGVVDVQNGINGLGVAFRGGGSFTGGYITNNALGRAVLGGGSFTINGTATGTNTVQDAGNLVGANVIQGGLTWVSGSWNDAGPITVTANSKLQIVSVNDHNMANCILTNFGTVIWADGRLRGGGVRQTVLHNFGLWDALNDQVINNDFGTGVVFNNPGTFRKSGGSGAGSTAIQGGVIFNSTGTVDVQTNFVSFQGGGTFTGGAIIGDGLVRLGGGAFRINGASTTTNVQLTGGSLTGVNVLTGGFTWVSGSWNEAGPITVTANSQLQIVSANDHNMANCVLTNLGTVLWADGRIRGGGVSQTVLHNVGLWDAQNDQVINNDFGTGTVFFNSGAFRKSGGTNTTSLNSGVAFENTGTLDVPANIVTLQGGGSFRGGAVTGNGLVKLAGGAFTINGALTTTNVQLTGGSLVGANVFRGGFTWDSGPWNSSGPNIITTNSTLQIVTANDHNVANCVVTNFGTVVWADGRIRGGGASRTVLHNFGLWDAQNDQVINNDFGTDTVFVNAGTFRKSGGANTTSLNAGVAFENTGTLDVPANTVTLQGGGSFRGGAVTGNGLVKLTGGDFTINGALTTTNVQLSGGSLVGANVFQGGFTWVSGPWNSSGPNTITPNTTLQIVSANDHNIANCVLTNLGTVLWADGRIRGGGASRTVLHNVGVWEAQNDQVINNDFGTGTDFVNSGTLRKSGGAGTTALLSGVTFNNQSGAIEVDSGQLSVGGNSYVQGSGLFAVKLGGTGPGQFGRLLTSSSALLGGPFNATLANGFAPAVGDVFHVLASANRTGTFSTVKVPPGISVTYSNNGVFLLVTGAVIPLQITRQPTNQTVAVGGTATFTVTATGAEPLTYRWHANGTDLSDGGHFSGAATSTLTISSASTADLGIYSVTITDAVGSTVTSSNAILSSATCLPPPSGLVGWWPGDANPNDIIDGHSGAMQGGASFAEGQVGQAFSLNGTDAFVQAPSSTALDPTTAGSQAAWVFLNQLPSDAGHRMQIIGKGSSGKDFDLQVDPDNRVRFYVGAGTQAASTTLIQTGAWYHVVGTWDSAADIKMYINGALENANPAQVTRSPSGEALQIGNQPFFGSRLFNGRIDEVEIYNRALSADEVAALFNAGSAGQCKPSCPPGTPGCPNLPAITCPANITTNSVPGQCSRTLAFAPTVTGTPTPTLTCRIGATVITSPYPFPAGVTTVSCTVSNSEGTAECTFTVTVQDQEPPAITCPAALTVACDTDVPAPNPASVIAADTCDAAPVVAHVSDVSAGACPRVITRTYKATDKAGNSATCTQTITVHDTIPPVISGCADASVAAASGQLGTTVNFAVTATDNCDGSIPVICTPAAGYFAVGQTPVTCEAVDRCGNRSSCAFTVTVAATADALRACAFTQGFYGNAKGRFNGNTSFTLVSQLVDQGPLVVGKVGSRSLSVLPGDAALLQARMPAGGPPAALPNNGDQPLQTAVLPLNPKGRFANVFLGQTITLSLNVRLSSALLNFPLTPSFCTQGTLAGPDGLKGTGDDVLVPNDIQTFTISTTVLGALSSSAVGINDSSVKGLLELANRALASLPTGNASVSDINAAVDAINRGFDECRAPVNCSTSPVVADSFNDAFATRPTLGSTALAALALQALAPASPSGPAAPPLNIRVRSSNLTATKDPGEPDIASNPGGKSVWWQWQAPRTGPVTIETTGSSFDTLLGVYTGTALSSLVLVAANDDANDTLTSQVRFEAQAGVTYQIAVDGVDGGSGEIVLTLISNPPRLCQPLVLVGDQLQLCIDGEVGRIYTVEASPDLANWTLLGTALINDGILQLNDLAKSNVQRRFYRVTFEP